MRYDVVVLIVITAVIITLITQKSHAVLSGRYAVFPICTRCHQTVPHVPNGIIRGWQRFNDHVMCVDHLFVDGSSLLRLASKFLDVQTTSTVTARPPSRYFYRCSISKLQRDGFTPYEVFCARVGRRLKRAYPELTTVRHVVNTPGKGKTWTVFLSSNMAFVDAPIGASVRIREQKHTKWVGEGMLKFYMWTQREYSETIGIYDWRFFYRKLNVHIDVPCTDEFGNEVKRFQVWVVQTHDEYFAIGPR